MRFATLVVTFAALSSACDRSPTRPSMTEQPSSPRTLASVQVVGPTLVTTGETARYTATAGYSDGSSEDVTRTVQWTPVSNPQTSLYFTQPGVAMGVHAGETVVRAFLPFGPPWGSLVVGVLDPGTFELSGVVAESGAGALHGVTIAVVSGTGQGLQTRTDANGRYAFYGVAGRVRLRASFDGFAPEVQDRDITRHRVIANFALMPVETTADVSGIWTMTVAPSPSCRAGFPEIARDRPYQVELIQHGTRLRMHISGPALTVHNPKQHVGTVLGSRVRLVFVGDTEYGEWSAPDIYDRLSPTEQFGFDGAMEGSLAGALIRGTLNGDLVYINSETTTDEPAWYCRTNDHDVTLRRGSGT
jgi:hypothetical protein